MNSIFVTGCAGFIGFHVSRKLLEEGWHVVGLDNVNDYYDINLKEDRLHHLKKDPSFTFVRGSLENLELLHHLFHTYSFSTVVHLAAQAGVRYSIENPHTYIQSNLIGFTNILECCRKQSIPHLLYASSSSVYGANKEIPFSVSDRTETPVSLYAATKKANELLAYTYSHLYQLPTTGLRFFTVYGPWGRPDMAYFSFTNAIEQQKPIFLYNNGNMKRDFTYIDDVVEAVYRLLPKPSSQSVPYTIHNIGNTNPVTLEYFVTVLEKELQKTAIKKYLPMQPGDVETTFADIDSLSTVTNFTPKVSIEQGLAHFVDWYKQYYSSI